MMDYKFYSTDQIGHPFNYNILSGILPQSRVLEDVKDAYDYEGAIIVIDSNIHKTILPTEIFNFRNENSKQTRLLVDYAYETGLPEEMYDRKIKEIVSRGIDIKDVLFVFNRSAFANWMEKHINNIMFIDLFAVSAAVRHAIGKMPVSEVLVKDRPRKINLLVGKIDKPSRSLVLQSFYTSNLKDSTTFSVLGMPNGDANFSTEFLQFLKDNQGPLDGALTFQQGDGVSSQGWSDNTSIYDNSSVSVICETHETNDSLFITEKTYRPIINRHPFVARASFPLLTYLRAIGFKTFNTLIDESYESSEISSNQTDRLVSAAGELLEQTQTQADQVQAIVDHNYETLIKFAQSELSLLNQRIFDLLK